jgi:hypothetical protein
LTYDLRVRVVEHVRHSLRLHLGPRRVARVKRVLAPLCWGNLTRLGRWYGSNKASEKQLYTPYYEAHIGALRRRPLRLLEIGVGGYGAGPQSGGASLRMWRTWMPRAQVVGIDITPRDFDEPRIATETGDQADVSFLADLSLRRGPFDIVIDDGSHRSADIITSFHTLWPLLRPDGFYVIEDLSTSYMAEYGGGPPGTSGTSVEMIKELVDAPTTGGDVAAIHVYPHIAFIRKAAR